nr:GGDEF domain-containing protein [Micromonospora tarapacensis]
MQEAERQSRRDPLTGLLNRAGLADAFGFAQTSYVLAMLDLDGFKEINDEFGHAAGDAVLKAVADSLHDFPMATRMGGDEFVLAGRMPGGPPQYWPVQLPGGELICVHATVGLAPVVIGDLALTLRQADAAMYRAKKFAPGALATYDPDLDDKPVRPRPRVRLRDQREARR